MGDLDGILPADGRRGFRGGNEGLENAFQGGLGGSAHLPNRLRGLVTHPAVRVGELFHQDRQGLRGVDQSQRFAGTLDEVRITAIGELDERGDHRLAFRALREFLRRPTADDGRPVAECLHKLLGGHFLPVQIEAPCRDGRSGLFPIQPAGFIGTAAGDDQFAQRQGISENIGGGRAQVVVAALPIVGVVIGFAGSILFTAIVGERAVRPAHEVEVP